MAKVGDRVVKVVCKLCSGQHNYRGEKTAASPASPTGGGGISRIRRRKTASVPEVKAPPVFDPSKPPRSYSPRESYAVGERIIHATFGTGVVASLPGAGKVDVHFPSGERTLACAKGVSTLERPVAVQITSVPDSPAPK
jgi:hypothetical protein